MSGSLSNVPPGDHIQSVHDFQQAGGKVAFMSLKKASIKEQVAAFDPVDAKLFKRKRFPINGGAGIGQ